MAAYADRAESGPGLVLGNIQEDCKPVAVAIDFGTTHSGIAFAFKSMPGNVQYGAPTATDPFQTKVPTVLLELPGDKWEFGQTAEAKYNEILAETDPGAAPAAHLYKRFKMALKGMERGIDTLTAVSTSGKSHNLLALVARSLEYLKDYALSLIRAAVNEVIHENDVQWVLTVPAIWNDFGKAFMRKAAFKAGMMEDEQSDNLMLVLEPEAAALAVHVGASQFGLLGAGSRFMVLDYGRGVCDITAHEVQTVQPLSMKAIAAPSGGDWGGDYVNELFKMFLQELLGPDLFDEQGLLLEFLVINAEFEKIKLMFDPSATDPPPLRMVDVLERKKDMYDLAVVWNAKHPEKPITISRLVYNGFLTMSKELMLSFFEPIMCVMVDHTQKKLRDVPGVSHIVVVGDFGSSKVLTTRIRDEFDNKGGVRVILPEGNTKAELASLKGAVYFGLYMHKAQPNDGTKALHTYAVTGGVSCSESSTLIHEGETLHLDHSVETIVAPKHSQDSMVVRLVEVESSRCVLTLVVKCPKESTTNQRWVRCTVIFRELTVWMQVENARGDAESAEVYEEMRTGGRVGEVVFGT